MNGCAHVYCAPPTKIDSILRCLDVWFTYTTAFLLAALIVAAVDAERVHWMTVFCTWIQAGSVATAIAAGHLRGKESEQRERAKRIFITTRVSIMPYGSYIRKYGEHFVSRVICTLYGENYKRPVATGHSLMIAETWYMAKLCTKIRAHFIIEFIQRLHCTEHSCLQRQLWW